MGTSVNPHLATVFSYVGAQQRDHRLLNLSVLIITICACCYPRSLAYAIHLCFQHLACGARCRHNCLEAVVEGEKFFDGCYLGEKPTLQFVL